MSKFWLIIWFGLLACQMFAIWIQSLVVDETDLPARDLDEDLISLAKLTNKHWEPYRLSIDNPSFRPTSHSENLMTRESLILRLMELERDLNGRGAQLEVVQELQAYLGTLNGSENVEELNTYLVGMIDWISKCSAGDQSCLLERLNLFPESSGGLPSMVFEFSGDPLSMGQTLVSSVNDAWHLDELDLLMPKGDMESWMRGSYVFNGK